MGTLVELIAVAIAELHGWEPLWRQLEAAAPEAAPFVCFDWLAAWARTHEPSGLAVVLVGSPASPLALGLVQLASGGRMRFGGWPVSSTRALLVRPGAEDEAWAALADFVRLHQARWRARGERHRAMSLRLAALLDQIRDAPSARLYLDEMRLDGRRVAVNVALSRGAVHWGYNFGVDPAVLRLGPGIALQQISIRDAIEDGCRRLDMGPGASEFKLRAGGAIDDRVDVRAVSPTVRGRSVATLARLRAPARKIVRR